VHVLREYALLADGQRGALVGPRGDIVWMCAPRWDSDAVFSALVGGGGAYAITPADPRFVWGGFYEDDTLIWRSRWVTSSTVIECREALAYPGDKRTAVLLRRVMAPDADAHVTVHLGPAAGFGSEPLEELRCEDGVWTGRTGALRMRWRGGGDARPVRAGDGRALAMDLTVPAGSSHDLVLELTDGSLPDSPPDPGTLWLGTEHTWERTVPRFDESLAPHDTRHAYAVLSGLTTSGGGMVAAATMGLPERAEAGRNYDYRYVWIRDQCLAGQAIASAGPHPLLDDAVRFMSERLLEHGPKLAPAYTPTGGRIPDERTLPLDGFPGGRAIVGNHVNAQSQLDTFGESLLLLAAAARHDHLDADGWRAAETAARAVAERWQEPEAGLWELDDRQWTESRLICVAGLRAISAAPSAPAARTGEWLALASTILADTAARCTHPTGRWQRAPDDDRVDAALLLPGLRGALPPDDPRTAATVQAVRTELDEQRYVYRFRQKPGPLEDAEGAFLLCGFLAAMACQQQGDTLAAARYFERNRAACGPPALFSEEYDVRQKQLRGNLPQAFVHAAMFEASTRLSQPWEAGR